MGIFIPIVLGMLTAFGPFITDFYLPVMPEMTEYFHSSTALVSMSLTAGMIGLAAGQILIGPLTDKYGRKGILIGSLLLFVLASIGCVFCTDIWTFNAFRLFQGIGGAGGIVISKSMATDMYSGHELARFMALLGAINGVAPVCAPVIGGALSAVTAWQGVFVALLGIGILLALSSTRLHETLVEEKRFTTGLGDVYGNLFRVFRNPIFTLSTLSIMASGICFFGYIASSPFILQEIYGLSPFMYSICFAINALMIGVGAGTASLFRRQATCLRMAVLCLGVGTLAMSTSLLLALSIWILMPSYIILLAGFGLLQPVTTTIAMDSERNNAGAASAIFGASLFVAGGIASPLVGIGNLLWATSIVTVAGTLLCGACTLTLARRVKSLR
ncbi:MAG: Bcr/CflA family efflux MFS transporter [Bacteroidales bacterium]|nr:Bcr/CflA family efflux MFS transporter [Bacteroidales bacterium]